MRSPYSKDTNPMARTITPKMSNVYHLDARDRVQDFPDMIGSIGVDEANGDKLTGGPEAYER